MPAVGITCWWLAGPEFRSTLAISYGRESGPPKGERAPPEWPPYSQAPARRRFTWNFERTECRLIRLRGGRQTTTTRRFADDAQDIVASRWCSRRCRAHGPGHPATVVDWYKRACGGRRHPAATQSLRRRVRARA